MDVSILGIYQKTHKGSISEPLASTDENGMVITDWNGAFEPRDLQEQLYLTRPDSCGTDS